MTFTILPAEKEDLTILVEIFHEAFATDPEVSLINANCDMNEVIRNDVERYEKEFDTPGRRFFKLIDDDNGRIAAMSKWWYPYTLTPKQEADGVGVDRLPNLYPKGTLTELSNEFFQKLFDRRRKYVDHKRNYFVDTLAVRPEYQRKGLGSVLLEHGLVLADRDGARTYVEASAKGLGLYLKYGWKEIDAINIDTRPYGGQQIESTKCMMRDPQTPKSSKV